MRQRRYPSQVQQTVVPSGERTTNGNSDPVTGWARGDGAQSRLSITAASGTTPSMTVVVEDSPDATAWTVRDTYPAQTGAATATRAVPVGLDRYQRVRWTLTGTTPSFTFSFQFAVSTDALL